MSRKNENWTIVAGRGGYEVQNCFGDRLGTITTTGKKWLVRIDADTSLDFEWDNVDICIGYVRGVERLTQLHIAQLAAISKAQRRLVKASMQAVGRET